MLRMQAWDTAGQERFSTITPMMYRGVTGVILVYDITDRYSFERVSFWMEQLQLHADPGLKKVLVGNKVDLQKNRQVSTREGEERARHTDKREMKFFETSAMDGRNVEAVFYSFAQQAAEEIVPLDKRKVEKRKGGSFHLSDDQNRPNVEKGCKCGR